MTGPRSPSERGRGSTPRPGRSVLAGCVTDARLHYHHYHYVEAAQRGDDHGAVVLICADCGAAWLDDHRRGTSLAIRRARVDEDRDDPEAYPSW